jgi:hypothetical protein
MLYLSRGALAALGMLDVQTKKAFMQIREIQCRVKKIIMG